MTPGPGSGAAARHALRKIDGATALQRAQIRYDEAQEEYLNFLATTSVHESAAITRYAILRDRMDSASLSLAIERRHEGVGS